MKIAFVLTMPGNNSWNGKWTGDGKLYAIVKDLERTCTFPMGRYGYSFGDGWYAAVEVYEVENAEASRMLKASKGFWGYDWMVDSIIREGNIVCRATDGTIHRVGSSPRPLALAGGVQ